MSLTYPSRMILVTAINPCKCSKNGNKSRSRHYCHMLSHELIYAANLSHKELQVFD